MMMTGITMLFRQTQHHYHARGKNMAVGFMSLLLFLFHLPVYSQDSDAIARGQEILMPFKKSLMQALQNGLETGPLEALDACHIQAPAIARTHSADGIRVGRTSHKLRNPDNVSPAWAEDLLQEYVAKTGGWQSRIVQLGEERTGYVEPIVLQPLCTTCHGSHLSEPVLEKIQTLYPDDQATGFAPGDFRGLFWVEFTDKE